MNNHSTYSMIFIGMCVAVNAFADCDMRPATAKEIAYFKQTVVVLKSALPAPPASWTQVVREENALEFVCGGEGNFDVSVRASYIFHMPKEESDHRYEENRMLGKDIEKLRELPSDKKKEQQGWLDKMSEANRASNKAYKDGDKKLARTLSDEADGYSQKGHEVRDKYLASVQPKIEQLEAKQRAIHYGDQEVNVRFIANEPYAESVAPGTASELIFGKMPKDNKTGLKVYAIRLIATGNQPWRNEILNAIERDKLERLVR